MTAFKQEKKIMWISSFIILFFCNVLEGNIFVYNGEENIEEFSDRELSFSQPIEKYGLEGAIVLASPSDACSKIAEPPSLNYSMNWFVLIAGNFCDYNTKLTNAQSAGYSAAVIYNSKGRDDKSYMQENGYDSNISAVTIRTSNGLIIKDNYLYTVDSRFWILLIPNHSYTKWHFFVGKYFSLFIAVAFFGIFLAVPLGMVRIAQFSSRTRLTKQLLNQLQTSRFQKDGPYETCAICLEDYQPKDKLRILPCQHGYHTKCIDPWLTKKKGICPVCKQKVVLSTELSESDVENRSETASLLHNSSSPASFNDYRALSGGS